MRFPKEIESFLAGKGESVSIYKSGPGTAAFLAAEILESGRSVALCVPGLAELTRLQSLLALLLPVEGLPFWRRPWAAPPSHQPGQPTTAFWAKRWAFLHAAAMGSGPRILLFAADNLLPQWPTRKILDDNSLLLAKGEEIPRETLLEQCAAWGYRRTPMAANPGEIAARGDVLDVFPPGYDTPVRFEFFGDLIEALRLFDPMSQRSLSELDEVLLLPAAPAVLSESAGLEAQRLWDKLSGTGELHKNARLVLQAKLETGDGTIWPGLWREKPATFEDWLPKDCVRILYGASQLRSRIEENGYAWRQFFEKEAAANGFSWPAARVLWPEGLALKSLGAGRRILFEDLAIGRSRLGPDLPETTYEHFSELFWRPGSDRRPWTTLVAALKEWRLSRERTILSFHSERSRNKFLKMIEPEELVFATRYDPRGRGLFALVSPMRKGVELTWAGLCILPEDVLSPEAGRSRAGAPDRDFKGLLTADEIALGDLVAHRDYGVASFEGLARMTVDNAGGDYLLLHFANDDKLYLPADKMGLIQRYKGPEGVIPPLDRLGGARWRTAKSKAKKAIERIAQDLVEMYAYRKVAKGFAYGPVNELFLEFETTFGFEETPDQEKAIAEVLADMERPEPMDRLVCGDVGFGKTEVALRAAFRAVLDGKQVVMLCPTTVLAEQHYQNFTARLEGFPVNVGMLSRFVDAKRSKVILDAAAKGQVDILVGTHRLLSKDVTVPKLGLLILDEEQRFGVKHKERLKALRKNIDVLTLTATPIPRTLQLSLSGIRGLSVIETPPMDRKAVETALVERDPAFLRQVLARELERQGQVFWVHNRVQGLERTVEFVKSLAPDARVGMAHGQMAETALEKVMRDFWHGEVDILVCTAIIESGLDFPRANTLVVDQAQMFGLGQLYQLRGRVGRSSRQAFAYFTVPSIEGVPESARKRMRVIMDMDYLGAGFRVAMEDLRLRGAGNILGEAQSGAMAGVGLDLFLEMLDEEVRRLKGEPVRERTDPELSLAVPARIPERYVTDSRERLRLYKALSSAQDERAMAALAADVRDRFGHLPEELENFIAILLAKQVLSRLRAARAEIHPGRIVVGWEEAQADLSPERLVAWIKAREGRARMLPPARLELRLDGAGSFREALGLAAAELGELTDEEGAKES